jgi:hypothetical protein
VLAPLKSKEDDHGEYDDGREDKDGEKKGNANKD